MKIAHIPIIISSNSDLHLTLEILCIVPDILMFEINPIFPLFLVISNLSKLSKPCIKFFLEISLIYHSPSRNSENDEVVDSGADSGGEEDGTSRRRTPLMKSSLKIHPGNLALDSIKTQRVVKQTPRTVNSSPFRSNFPLLSTHKSSLLIHSSQAR